MTLPSPHTPPPVTLDLRGTPCPVNYVRSRLAMERLPSGAWLQVDLDAGEPERMVSEGLRGEGHAVRVSPLEPGTVRLLILRDGEG